MTLVLAVLVEALETFLRLLQPNSLAAFCWLISVVSAFLTHPPCITTIHHSAVCCLSHSVVLQVLYSQTLPSAHDFILLSWWCWALARWARERLIKNNFRNEQTTPARQFDWAPVIECLYSPTKSTGSAVLDFKKKNLTEWRPRHLVKWSLPLMVVF